MNLSNEQLKEIVNSAQVVDEEILKQAYDEATSKKISLWSVLIEKDILGDDQIGQLVAVHMNTPFVNLRKESLSESTLLLIPKVVAKGQQVIAFESDQYSIKIGTPNVKNLPFFHVLQKKTGKDIVPYYATEQDVKEALAKYKKGIKAEFDTLIETSIKEAQKSRKEETPIRKIVDLLLDYGYENNASDIHVEPMKESLVIRFRIDGILHDVITVSKELEERLVSRIKVLCKLRTDEHSSAQDGKFVYQPKENDEFDVRVSIVPVAFGEKVVMRLLSSKNKRFSLHELGLSDKDFEKVQDASKSPYGMILATGPTGSGKTTTLYAILKILNKREVNIATIEDPIEYSIEGVNQIQVNPKTNLTFASGLKSILRQDPDIIMVGEIRDEDTANIATNAATTGHIVLSTLHTNDAATTLPRLLDMKIEPYLIASTINVVIAQRLVRKICTRCIRSHELTKDDIKLYENLAKRKLSPEEKKNIRVYTGKGCDICNKTGYIGRIGIFEVLEMNSEIHELIMNKEPSDKIREAAMKNGMTTMYQDGLSKVLRGVTTLEEVTRATKA